MSESPGRNLGLDLVRVTEAAALAAGRWMGRGQKEAGDGAAVRAMRLMLATVEMDGAVDPVEGTSLLAHGRPDAIAVIAVAPRATMWSPGPAFYMDKLCVGREAREAVGPTSLTAPVADTLKRIGDAKSKPVESLTVFVLDKPRHVDLIAEIRAAGARVLLRTDGDVAGALLAATPGSGVDVLMGIGGTPEGIIAACAVRALGGAMLGRLAPQKPGERAAVVGAGLVLDRVLTERDLVESDDVFFAATGITDGVLMPGVRYTKDGATTDSMVVRGRSGTQRMIHAEHRWDKLMTISPIPY